MSASASSSVGSWLPNRARSKRGKLRNGTFVDPTTGERSRRQFTLRHASSRASSQPDQDRSIEYSESMGEYAQYYISRIKSRAVGAWQWLNTDEGHQVFKCSLAYLLGSTGTFWPPLAEFLGHRDGKHVVATITVYFHPARSAGSMLEAIMIACAAISYAVTLCLLSMWISIEFQDEHQHVVSHVLTLVIFVGGGLGFVGWVKQKLSQPLVNVASSLTSIALITVLTKEEAIHDGYWNGEKIVQVFKMLLLGVSFTTAVNLLLWPISARRLLRKGIVRAATSLSDKISLITSCFLRGVEEEQALLDYESVCEQFNAAQAIITKSTREAKFEHYFLGKEKIYALDKRLIKSIENLSQAVGGLRSALDTQFTLLKETPEPPVPTAPIDSPNTPSTRASVKRTMSSFIEAARDKLAVIDESNEEEANHPQVVSQMLSEATADQRPTFNTPSDIFALFIELLGPPMKSLAYTLSETLRVEPFGTNPVTDIVESEQLRESLREALSLYHEARTNALRELYKSIELGRARSEEIQADIEEVAAACGHFSFSLQAVAEEMGAYLDALDELKTTTDSGRLGWGWLQFWRSLRTPKRKETGIFSDPERDTLLEHPPPIKRLGNSAVPKGIPDTMVKKRDSHSWDAAAGSSNVAKKISKLVLSVLRFVSREDILFGIKVGIGAVIWAMFAYIPATRPIYQHWRGEWGLLSFMIVVSMTTGAANTTGNARFLGTMVGAVLANVGWLLCQGNPWALAFFGWAVAFWNFYLIVVLKNAPLGRITQLAYNVVVLYAYSISQYVDDDDDDEGGTNPMIFSITYHRVVSVTLGIVWGIAVCRLLWPISGRRKFREGLAVLYLQLGLIWKRGALGTVVSSSMLDYMREGEQAALQRYANKLETLRGSAASEFELRGPFPHAAYGRIMASTRQILDGFYAMRLITQKRQTLSEGEKAVLEYTEQERKLFRQRICHVFQVLASCIMLEYPLTDAIPTVDRVRDQLLSRIHLFRKGHMRITAAPQGDGASSVPSLPAAAVGALTEESDYALLYAYMLVSTQIAEELKRVRKEIEGLFGVLDEEVMLLE